MSPGVRLTHYTLDDLQAWAGRQGGVCLALAYRGVLARYPWRCQEGHEWKASAASVRSGRWCRVCAGLRRRLGLEAMRREALERGGRCLAEAYRGAHTPLPWECAQGHHWSAPPSYIRGGRWCPACAKLRRGVPLSRRPAGGAACEEA